MILSKKAKEKLRPDNVKSRVALDINKSRITLSRWMKSNHEFLTLRSTIDAIKKHTGLKESEIFEK